MAKSPKSKYKIVIGSLKVTDPGDGKEKRPEEMTQPMGPETNRMRGRFSEQLKYDKLGHEIEHPKSARETLPKRFKSGRAKHTPHPAPVQGAQYKQTPQMERPHYEETKMKTLSQFMNNVVEARDDDDDDTGGAKKHIIAQMRKVISMRGEHHVEFKDGKKHKLTPAIAHKALEMHDNMNKPADKEEFTHHIGQSIDHLKSGLKGNWRAEKKPKITLAGPKFKKEEAEIEEAKDSYAAYQRRMGMDPVKAAKKEGEWSKKIKKQEKQLKKEEVDQLDELSLGTVLAYTAKSTGSAAKAAGAAAGKAAVAGAKKAPEMIAKAAKATGKAISGVAGGIAGGGGPGRMPNPEPEDKEDTEKKQTSPQKPEKEQNLADKLYNRRNEPQSAQGSDQEIKATTPDAQKKTILQKRMAGLNLARKAIVKKATTSMKTEAKDDREYGYEGEMAMSQIKATMNHSKQLLNMLKPDSDLPEWVQSKITLAADYMQTAADYMMTQKEEVEHIDEAVVTHISFTDRNGNTHHIKKLHTGEILARNQGGNSTSLANYAPLHRGSTAEKTSAIRSIIKNAKDSHDAAEKLNKSGLGSSGWKSHSTNEDYAPLKAGKALAHPDDANSPADSKTRKQGAEKPVALKDPAKYMKKEAREFYEGLSDENREKFLSMSLAQIDDLLDKYRNQ